MRKQSWYDKWLLRYSGRNNSCLEWKSKSTLFGIPLFHVNLRPFGIAKGILSVGSMAIGLFSFGGCSIGLIGFGGISFSLFALGGIAFGWFSALGGLAISWHLAVGGLVLANHAAIGGFAVAADIAIGSEARAAIVGYTQHGIGESLYPLPDQSMQLSQAVKGLQNQLPQWLYRFIQFFLMM